MSQLITRIDGINYAGCLIPATEVCFHYSLHWKDFIAGKSETIEVINCTESRTYHVQIYIRMSGSSSLWSEPWNWLRLLSSTGESILQSWTNYSPDLYRKQINGANSNLINGGTFSLSASNITSMILNVAQKEWRCELLDLWIW